MDIRPNVTTRIVGPTKFEGGATAVKYELEGIRIGATCKNVVFSVKVLHKSSTSVTVELIVAHGPDGYVFRDHSTPIATTALGASYTTPCVVNGSTDTDTDGQLAEWLQTVLSVGGGANEYVIAEIYVLAKPY